MSARMSQRNVLRLYLARQGQRSLLVQEGFAILGLAIGVALLFASQVASTSLDGSVSQLTEQVVGHTKQMQLQARGPSGFSQRLVRQIRSLDGVVQAMPVLEEPVNLRGPGGRVSVQLLGADPRDANVGGPLLSRFGGKALAAVQAIALPAPVAQATGEHSLQPVGVQVGARWTETIAGAVLPESEIGALAGSPIALAPIAYAQALTDMQGKVSRIFVRPAYRRAQAVHSELARIAARENLNLAPATADAQLFAVASRPESEGELLFSVISAVVGFMLAFNAMLISAPPRRKLIDLAVQAGATRVMIVQILLFDAVMLAFFGIVIGLGLGDLLSIALFHSTPGYLTSAFPIGNHRIVTWQPVLLAAAAAILAAVAGVMLPLRDRIMRPAGGEEIRTARHSYSLTAASIVGVCCLAVTTVILVADPQAAIVGAITLFLALICLLPTIFDSLVRLVNRLVVRLIDEAQQPRIGAPLKLAVTQLQAPPTRVLSLAIAATGAVAVFGTVSVGGAQSNLQRGLDASARAIDSSANVWVAPSGQSSVLATMPFNPIDTRRLEDIPGVRAVGIYRGGFLDWGERRLWVLAQPSQSLAPVPVGQLLKGSLPIARERIRRGGWAVLSAALAKEHHLHIGERFTLPAPQPTPLRVTALATNLGWPPGAIVMSSADYARAWRSNQPSAYEIQTSGGTSPSRIEALVQHALGPSTGLRVETLGQRVARHYALAAQGLSRLAQIRLLVLLAAILATTAATGAMLWQRRDHVAWFKCLGYDEGVLRRWLAFECATMFGAGCLIGGVAGIYGEVLNSHALAIVTGFPVYFHIAALLAITNFAEIAAAALAIVYAAGYLVVRVPIRTTSPAY
jgi:putative ABC transport system permease protein